MERDIKIIFGVAKIMNKQILKKNSIDGTKRKNVGDRIITHEENMRKKEEDKNLNQVGIKITKDKDNIKEKSNLNKNEGDKNNKEMKRNILEEKIMKELIILEIIKTISKIIKNRNSKNRIKVLQQLF
jgi:hypothetical protein